MVLARFTLFVLCSVRAFLKFFFCIFVFFLITILRILDIRNGDSNIRLSNDSYTNNRKTKSQYQLNMVVMIIITTAMKIRVMTIVITMMKIDNDNNEDSDYIDNTD